MITMKFNIVKQPKFEKVPDTRAVTNHLTDASLLLDSFRYMYSLNRYADFNILVSRCVHKLEFDIPKIIDVGERFKLIVAGDISKDKWKASNNLDRARSEGLTHILCSPKLLQKVLGLIDYDVNLNVYYLANPDKYTLHNVEEYEGNFFYHYVPGIPSCERARDMIINHIRDDGMSQPITTYALKGDS